MTTFILLACSILATAILAWLFRQRFASYLPRKETMTTMLLFAPIALLLILALLPDLFLVISTMNLMPPFFRIVLALAAAVVICVGCSKKAETPKQPAIQWSAPDTGYHAETATTTPNNKEDP